ncbi:DUF1330 domain-containing protein [Bradyrhizobium iriomotense]|nr:DUF1330 domain-containing protein [Bradyrhizobium iriomotense]
MPKPYLIAEHFITEPAIFEEYRVKVGPMIEKYGGRYLKGQRASVPGRRPLGATARRRHRIS